MKRILACSILFFLSSIIDLQAAVGGSDSKTTDPAKVPYLPYFNVLGFKLGESLSGSGEKADLLLSSDFDKIQFFNLVNPPKKTINKVTLAYAKKNHTSNLLYYIRIDYDKRQIDREDLLLNLPPDGKVLEKGVNVAGIYVHRTSHPMLTASVETPKVNVEIRIFDRPDGTLSIEYYIKDVYENIWS